MAKFCSNCGAPLDEGSTSCSACGYDPASEAPAADTPAVTAAPAKEAPNASQVQYIPCQPQPADNAETKVISTGAFFGLMLLFSIPVVGFISALIMTFACRNKNLRHYALAALIWMLVAIVLTVILGAVALFILRMFSVTLNTLLSEALGVEPGSHGLEDLIEQYARMYGYELPEDFMIPDDLIVPDRFGEITVPSEQ